jgi:radical S-adenosyl methionine domain-containing protein 2
MRLFKLFTQLFLNIWNTIQSYFFPQASPKQPIPLSVNYHLTRACNYRCKFCFHTALTKDCLPLDEAKHGIRLLQKAGTKKINFSGGEPFLMDQGRYVGELTRFAKEECQMATSIVSNGSLIFEKWFEMYSKYLDILAISCDSFDDECNRQAGRTNGKQSHSQISHVRRVRHLCEQ